MNVKDEFFHQFASKVFNADNTIRFVALTDSDGHVLGADHRKEIINKMTEKELEEYIRLRVQHVLMTDRFRGTAGQLRYVLAVSKS